MSQLVEDNFFVNFNPNFLFQDNSSNNFRHIIDSLISRIQRANAQGYNFKIKELEKSSGKLTAVIHLKFQTSIFDLIVEICIDLRNRKLCCTGTLLEDQYYYLSQNSLKRKVVCRKLLKINQVLQLQGFKFIQNMQNGKINLLTSSQESQQIFNSKDLLWTKIRFIIKKIFETYETYNLDILQILDKEKYKIYFLKKGGEQLKKIKKQEFSYSKLVKQLEVSHIDFGFSSKADESSYPNIQKSKNQQKQLRQFVMNVCNQKFQHNSKRIYLSDYQQFLELCDKQISYEMQHAQSALYSSYLKTPVPRDPNPGQNKFIFNHVQIVKPETVRFKDTNLEGGNNKIKVSKVQFYYCQSQNVRKGKKVEEKSTIQSIYRECFKMDRESKVKHSNPILVKMIATKIPKKISNLSFDAKIQNQKNIIKFFKNGVSAYILKYYVSTQLNFQFKDSLLMDYLPNCQPLSNFLEIFKETLSLNSKIYLLVNIANSIRFINDYDIVHMDLNLNNIIIYRDYLTKLIDFGQAYSPNLNTSYGSKFKRGYTFPFSSPQYFQKKQNFNVRQDIFSFGIIIFRMIFNDYPFFPSKNILQAYKKKNYNNKIFIAPQRGEVFGNSQAINLLYNLIFRCISPYQSIRCQPSWITILLKIIYFHLL